MKRPVILLMAALLLAALLARLFEATAQDDAAAGGSAQRRLLIYGAVDHNKIQPLFDAFSAAHPQLSLRYREFNSLDLYRFYLEHPEERPDLMLSPAMDLQFKLVNDGYALSHSSASTEQIPARARWRNELFGYAVDPIVIAINTDILAGASLPQSREQLLALIRSKNHLLDEKLGLSDIKSTGLGYLTWSYDSQLSRTYERLLEAFGIHHSRLYQNTDAMLEALTRGEIFIAYNALGSYTREWSKEHPWIVPVLPTDYTTVILRTAFISASTRNPDDARAFIDYLLSEQGQQLLAERTALIPVRLGDDGDRDGSALLRSSHSLQRPIPLGLELLLQSDAAKRQLLFDEWDRLMPHTGD